MLEEIKTFIEFLKSGFHLDEIEKSMYFVKQKEILNQRIKILDQEIAELNKKLGEPEKDNGGFKVSNKTVPLLMAIKQEREKQERLNAPQINFVEERAEENKTFFKLRPTAEKSENKVAENKTFQDEEQRTYKAFKR